MSKKARQASDVDNQLIGHKAIADYLKVSPETTKKWASRPELQFPVFKPKFGRQIVACRVDLDKWMTGYLARKKAILVDPAHPPKVKPVRVTKSSPKTWDDYETQAFDAQFKTELNHIAFLAAVKSMGITSAQAKQRLLDMVLQDHHRYARGEKPEFSEEALVKLLHMRWIIKESE
jgi:hypothetical protein